MNFLACLLPLFALHVIAAFANTEKVIFIAPPGTTLPDASPSLDDLQLSTLSPTELSARLSLPVAFPNKYQPAGLDSWYLIKNLNEGQRYEVRVCWVAVQPTSFTLDTYVVAHVFDTPDLISNLATFSEQQIARRDNSTASTAAVGRSSGETRESLLFLRVQSAADFFTSNTTLMQHPPNVDVDIILDPYIANIFPQSLVLTAIYIVSLALGGWVLSGIAWTRLFSSTKQHVD